MSGISSSSNAENFLGKALKAHLISFGSGKGAQLSLEERNKLEEMISSTDVYNISIFENSSMLNGYIYQIIEKHSKSEIEKMFEKTLPLSFMEYFKYFYKESEDYHICPLTQNIALDPVRLKSDGKIYDKEAILNYRFFGFIPWYTNKSVEVVDNSTVKDLHYKLKSYTLAAKKAQECVKTFFSASKKETEDAEKIRMLQKRA